MLVNLFNTVKSYGVPVTLREFLDLLNGLDQKLVFADWNNFYFLARTLLVKDEKYFDKFDRAFDIYFRGIKSMDDILKMLIPDDWVRQNFEKELSKEDLEKIVAKSKELDCKIVTTEKDFLRIKNNNFNEIKFIKSELFIQDEEKLINDIFKLNE